MTKQEMTKVAVLSIILSVAINVFFGRYLAVKLSTLPLLNKWNILSPQAPIVLTSREVVRVTEGADILQVVNNTKPKLSLVLVASGNTVKVLGGALNLTSDGLFVTTKSVVGSTPMEQMYVQLNDGSVVSVAGVVSDRASNVVILKTDAKNISVASIGESKRLQVGEKILFLTSSSQKYSANFVQSSVYSSQQDVLNKIYNSDYPTRVFGAQSAGSLTPGQSIVNMDGQVVGMWDGNAIISSDVIRNLSGLYLNNNQTLNRPTFAFWYKNVTSIESRILHVQQGALVQKGPSGEPAVTAGSGAAKAGLKEGDIITAVNDEKLGDDTLLEESLQRIKPGDTYKLTIVRGSDTITIETKAEILP